MSINYSPEIVTDGAVFVGDARESSTATAGSRLYDQAGVDSTAVKLLIHGDVGSGQSFADSSLSNHTVTAFGQITHSTTQSKFSGGSIYCDGSYDFLKIESSSVWVFDGDFTVDLWINPQDTGSGNLVGDYYIGGVSTSPDWQFLYSGTDQKMNFWRGSSIATSSNGSVLRNQWTHVALVRSGSGSNNCKVYVNGTLDGQGTFTTDVGRGLNLWVGIDGNEISEAYLGYMDEIRITKGVALWTQDFTPPARRDTLSISDGMMYNGSCLAFDGGDDWVDCGSSPITSNSAFSWAAWINPINSSGTPFFLGTNVAGEAMVSYWDSSTSMVRVGVWGADRLTSNIAIPANNWGHTCWTWDGTTLRAYTNGVAAGTATPAAFNIASNDMIIGAAAASAQEFEGSIGDVKLYNVALSASQVKEIYQDSKIIIPSNVSQTNLKGWWPLVDGAGDYAYDGSGNGNDGTLTNMTSADWLTGQTGCPQLVEGYNKVMLFDGSSDYVNCGASSALVTGTTLSISAWVKTIGSAKGRLFQGQKAAGSTSYSLVLNDNGGVATAGYVSCLTYTGAAHTYVSYDASIDDGAWHYLAMTTTASAQKLYVDGALVASGTNTFSNTVSADKAVIGSLGGVTEFAAGIINEVILYDSVLSLAQVQALAATGPNGGPLPPDPMSLSNSSDVVAYWRNDAGYLAGNVTWKNRVPGVIKNFTDVATDPINDSNSVGSWTNNGTSLTSVTGGRWGASGTPNGGRPPRYRLLFDSGTNMTVNSIVAVTEGKTYKVSAWYLAGSVTSAMLRVEGPGLSTPVSESLTSNTTYWTNKAATFTATATGNVTIELHNRATGTQYFDDVSLIESGPASDGTVITSPDILFFKQGYNGRLNTSTGRDNQGFPLLGKNNGAVGFNGSDNYITIDGVAPLMGSVTDFTISCWAKCVDNGANQILVAVNGAALGTVTLMRISCDNDNKYFDVYDGNGVDIAGTTNVADGNWHYFTYVRTGNVSNDAYIYVDGVFQNSGIHTSGLSSDDLWSIGQEWDAGPAASQFFNGQIANVQVYNRALSVAEITQNINAQRSRFI